ncbi:hypothetical protein J28TS4_49060 [Paenibacillus lautus]|nr:hypothetical protein J28TS4_49060 [Paenibacillus lautus]
MKIEGGCKHEGRDAFDMVFQALALAGRSSRTAGAVLHVGLMFVNTLTAKTVGVFLIG